MIGETIGHYRILEKLGEGGMGVVYKAQDLTLDRSVALKFLPEGVVTDSQAYARFLQEARAASAINHPNVCVIHELGRSDGRHFIAMEYVEGRTLRSLSLPLSSKQVAEIGLQIAEGLAAAHERKIVHRDIKAENIMLRADGRVQIMDFGLAKLRGVSKLTQTGSTLGTLAYMSPEQVQGEEPDQRTDLFSLGVVLYELLTGRLPFVGDSEAAVLHNILNQEPALPSRLRSDVDPALEQIILKCLEKDREHRYQSAREVAVDMRRVLGGREALPVPGRRQQRTRRRAVIAAAITVMVLVGAAALSRIYLGGRRPQVNSIAVLPLENLSGDRAQEYLADGMTEALISTLGEIKSLRVISRTSVMQFKGTRQPLPEIARRLGVQAIVEGSVVRSGQRVRVTAQLIHAPSDRQLWSRSYDRDFGDIITLQNQVARAVVGEIQKELTAEEAARLVPRPVNPEAHEAYLRGLYELSKPETEATLRAAIDQFARAVERDPQHALAWARMAYACGVLSLYPDPKSAPAEYWAKAKAAGLKAVKADPNLAEAHSSLAQAAFLSREFAVAEEGFRRALALNPNSARVREDYSYFLFYLGRMPEAGQQIQRAQDLDPLNITTSALAANWLFFARRYDEALTQIRKVLETEPNFPLAHSFVGRILIEKGMLREGMAAVQRAEELGFHHPWHHGFIGRAYVLMGNKVEAQKILAKLKEEAKTNAFADAAQSIIYTALGEKTQAIAALERGFKRGDTMDVLRTAPWWDPLRSDPRFKALERAVFGSF